MRHGFRSRITPSIESLHRLRIVRRPRVVKFCGDYYANDIAIGLIRRCDDWVREQFPISHLRGVPIVPMPPYMEDMLIAKEVGREPATRRPDTFT